MNWTQILADAGIPDAPGRAEAIEAFRQQREDRRRLEARQQLEASQKALERLAAKGDTRKAIRSKVRLGR
jgi:hypothetical protein